MPLLNDNIRRQLTDLFTRDLQDAVTLHFFTQKSSLLSVPAQECPTCRDAGELLNEVTALSDKLRLETHDLVADAEEARRLGVERIPGLVMQGKNKGALRYFGVPAGYEFGVVIEALTGLSRGTTQLTAETRKLISQLAAPVHIKVLVTPT
jgi:alkyl hydroperoxide reductase subunit AhpF